MAGALAVARRRERTGSPRAWDIRDVQKGKEEEVYAAAAPARARVQESGAPGSFDTKQTTKLTKG